ncbi:DUF6776 family protein [Variovorax sp. VNK109]|jgi:hypothetical protein|uniref:DUF6776 family protein n=1 Tax=Variovorax sp. VNK109 TaxID=3400919 RepID=UPI003C11431F
MRFRLLRRRLTISAPRMAVRSALPWPIRWIGAAIVLGFCAAIALWAFEFGKEIAGLEKNAKEELAVLRVENQRLREERDAAQQVANTSESVLTAEKSAQERLAAQMRQLEADNRTLRDDLGFFERLIPSSGEGMAIRGLQAELMSDAQMRWQVLVIQPARNAPEFNGRLELTLSGHQNGKPWTMQLPGGAMALQFRQYRRVEGLVDLPPQAVVQSVSARVMEGNNTRATQAVRL